MLCPSVKNIIDETWSMINKQCVMLRLWIEIVESWMANGRLITHVLLCHLLILHHTDIATSWSVGLVDLSHALLKM